MEIIRRSLGLIAVALTAVKLLLSCFPPFNSIAWILKSYSKSYVEFNSILAKSCTSHFCEYLSIPKAQIYVV